MLTMASSIGLEDIKLDSDTDAEKVRKYGLLKWLLLSASSFDSNDVEILTLSKIFFLRHGMLGWSNIYYAVDW